MDGTSLVLTHSENLDTGSVPAASAYTVRVDGAAGTNPSTVSVGTRTVTLTLATAVTGEQVVTVSYDVPASNRLQDVSGRNAPAFNNFAVTNNTDALVSNTHLRPTGSANLFYAQSFETGANLGGYTVSEVDIRLATVSGRSTSVKIRKNNADNEPGDLVATLTNPGTLTANSLNAFTAPAGTMLAASTTYWISVGEGISSDRAEVANNVGDDETGETGWSIGDGYLWRLGETDSWLTLGNSLLITIKGTTSTAATLSALTLKGADGGETITLSPAFLAETETYTAGVVNRIDTVKLTAKKNDDNAIVVITNDDDQTGSPEEALLDLIVGSNTLTVTVTAQDGTATRTYTITVERHTADTLISNTHLSPEIWRDNLLN